MKSKLPETNFAPPEPSPMAIIGAILAQGAIRYLDRQRRENLADAKKVSSRVESGKLIEKNNFKTE
jgi:hypothetical protein